MASAMLSAVKDCKEVALLRSALLHKKRHSSQYETACELAQVLNNEVIAITESSQKFEMKVKKETQRIELKPKTNYEIDFPCLEASAEPKREKRRIRATTLSTRPADGDIRGAPNFEGDLRSTLNDGAVAVFAMANAASSPKKNDLFITSTPPRKKFVENDQNNYQESCENIHLENETFLQELGALFALVTQLGSQNLGLSLCLEILCSAATVHKDASNITNVYLRTGLQCQTFALAAFGALRTVVAVLAGRTALHYLGVSSQLEEEALLLGEEGNIQIENAPVVRDLSLPFEAATDSRRAWETDAATRRSYNNREKTRDTFLRLLRDFEIASTAVDGRELQVLIPPEDEVFLFRAEERNTCLNTNHQRKSTKRQQNNQTLRIRASEMVRAVLPENIQWLASLMDGTLIKAASEINGKRRKLEARFFENEQQQTGRLERCLGSHSNTERFFYLFLKAADAARLETCVLDCLAIGIHSEFFHGKTIDLERLGIRARLAGLLLSDNIPTQLEAQRPWPSALCPVRILTALVERTATSDDRFRLYARVFLVASLCKPLRWESAFLLAPKESYLTKIRSALVLARKSVEMTSAQKFSSATLLAARLELDALVYRELRLPQVDITVDEIDEPNTPQKLLATPEVTRRAPTPLRTVFSSPRGNDDAFAEYDFNMGRIAIRASRPARNLASILIAALCRDQTPPAVLTRLESSARKQKLRPYLVTKPANAKDDEKKDRTARRTRFAPLVSSFFKRYPTIEAAVDLAIQAARMHAEAKDNDINSLLLSRLRPALTLALPPNAPKQIISIATNLAIERFQSETSLLNSSSSSKQDEQEQQQQYITSY